MKPNKFQECRAAWDREAPGKWWGDPLDARHWLWHWLPQVHGKVVLDIGCGDGLLMSRLDGSNERFGLDGDASALQTASRLNPGARLTCGRFEDPMPYADGSFDLVIAASAIEYSREIVPEAARVLKPTGMLLLTTPNAAGYRNPDNKLSLAELCEVLGGAGMDFRVWGWNPIMAPGPMLRSMARIPRMWEFLNWSAERIPPENGKGFLAVAKHPKREDLPRRLSQVSL